MKLLRKISLFASIKLAVALLCSFFGSTVFADFGPLAILGGQGNAPYAAFLQSDGSIVKLNNLPPTGLTFRVTINRSGYGISGGTSGINAYAALVLPNGALNPIAGLMAPGEIYSVAINNKGNGIIGGGHLNTNVPYAALISKKGIATSLNLSSSGLIYSVAIDNSGKGIVGGIGPLNSAYASIVSSNGAVTPLTGLPTTGAIYWVATNNSNTSFIGGQDNASVYAAFVNPNGSLRPIAGLPLGLNYSVALNASGNAIMGGTSLNLPYAALVAKNGSVITLKGLPNTSGKIYNVAINDSGAGLIAGFSTTGPYGSLVAPDGALTPLIGLPSGDGFLDGAALHSTGIGIVGGSSFNTPFAALVAPNGSLTYLNGLPENGEINSISTSMLDNLVPKSIGPFNSWANMQFALSDTLTQHCIIQRYGNRQTCSNEHPILGFKTDDENFSMWLSTFGNYVEEKGCHSFPTFSNKIVGALLGFDYKRIQDVVVGGGLAYTHNFVHYFQNSGKASINQESAVFYAHWNTPYYHINTSLWGGIFQLTNKRKSLTFITSIAKPNGWNLSPHLELSIPFEQQKLVLEPFIAFDWVNNWQSHFREQGSSGFNIKLKNQYASIFRSELGFRFFELLQCNWGDLIFEEKISYLNRTPIHKNKGSASFIGAASSFTVETLNPVSQNQGVIQMHVECIPSYLKNVYTSFDYQGAFGSLFQSHMATIGIGKNF